MRPRRPILLIKLFLSFLKRLLNPSLRLSLSKYKSNNSETLSPRSTNVILRLTEGGVFRIDK